MPKNQVQTLTTSWTAKSGVGDVLGEKLIQLKFLWQVIWSFWHIFHEGFEYFNTIAGFQSAIPAYHNPI